MQLSHAVPVRSVVFDQPSLVSHAGLVPAMALAERAGLKTLADRQLSVAGGAGFAAGAKVAALVGGMVAGADSIADMAVLRHGGMRRLFTGIRAPSTLGTFLRGFRFGHVRQLDAVAARFLIGLAGQAPLIATGAEITYVDTDDTVRAIYGYAKQGSGYGPHGPESETPRGHTGPSRTLNTARIPTRPQQDQLRRGAIYRGVSGLSEAGAFPQADPTPVHAGIGRRSFRVGRSVSRSGG